MGINGRSNIPTRSWVRDLGVGGGSGLGIENEEEKVEGEEEMWGGLLFLLLLRSGVVVKVSGKITIGVMPLASEDGGGITVGTRTTS